MSKHDLDIHEIDAPASNTDNVLLNLWLQESLLHISCC